MESIKKLDKTKIVAIFKYSFVKYIALAFGFLKSILSAKILGPELFGVLGNLLIILSYCIYVNLGIIYSMNREYVIYGEEDSKKRKEVIETSFTFLIVLSLFFIITSLISVAIYKNTYGVYLVMVFIIAVFEQFRMFFINYFRLKENLKAINRIEIINNIGMFILTLFLIKDFKIYGVLLSMVVCGAIIMIYSLNKVEKINIHINRVILHNLIRMGIPLLIYNLGFYILSTIDRWIIIKYYNNEMLGYYTFADSMVKATLVFITSILFLLYPKVIKAFNENINIGIIKKVNVYTELLETSSILFFLVGILIFEPFIKIFLPQYIYAIGTYIILLIAVILNTISYFANVYLVSNSKQKYLVYLQIMSMLINVGLNLFFVRLGFGIKGVALGTMITNGIYSFLQYSLFIKESLKEFRWRYIAARYLKVSLFCISISFLIFFNASYSVYLICSIIIFLILYIKNITKVSSNIKKIK